jgi:small subunit ribosomal protein S16
VLKIRLKRAGGRNHPFYRVVVVDSRKARDSRAVEEIGYYNPVEMPLVFNVDRDRVTFWRERGAQVSPALQGLLKRENSIHTSRRVIETFEPEPVEEAPPKPKKKAKTAKAKAAAPAGAPADEAKDAGAEAAASSDAASDDTVVMRAPVEEAREAKSKAEAAEEPTEA